MVTQVNALPMRGRSISPKLFIASLKSIISLKFPPGLFQSSRLLIKLKSPRRSQSASSGITKELNQFRKRILPSSVQGAYMDTRVHLAPKKREVSSMVSEYSFISSRCPTNHDPSTPQEYHQRHHWKAGIQSYQIEGGRISLCNLNRKSLFLFSVNT